MVNIDKEGYINSNIADQFMHVVNPTYLTNQLKQIFNL